MRSILESKPKITAPSYPKLLTKTCSCGDKHQAQEDCESCKTRTDQGDYASSLKSESHSGSIGHSLERIQIVPRQLGGKTKSLFPTSERTETLDTSTTEPAPSGGVNAGDTCSSTGVTGSFTSIPSGTLSAALSGSDLGAQFSMIGAFSPNQIPCSCKCGEYRQFVRGTFTRNGSPITHPLCGTNLDPTSFQEDCALIGGTNYKYGYRSQRFGSSVFTSPDQITGCVFNGSDFPRIGGSSGDNLAINLDFMGNLVDTCRNTILASSSWSVVGAATVP
jgi:hypothetical protein